MSCFQLTIDLLNSLLEAEQESVFRFMKQGSPFLGGASSDIRKTLDYLADADHRRAGQLWTLIEDIGGEPRPRGVVAAEQLLAYLSLKFLLPKLVYAKELLLQRYRNAVNAMEQVIHHSTDDERNCDRFRLCETSLELMQKQLSEHAGELAIVQQAALEVSPASAQHRATEADTAPGPVERSEDAR